ncbi:MAG TPA: hypothetical protein VH641_07500 [Streptosporangiaceae bacterium]|jgi:chromosome segregation ATPase
MVTMITAAEERLNSAFEEVEKAGKELKKSKHREQDAQTQVANTSGLAAAASRELKNVEARYRVLAQSHEIRHAQEAADAWEDPAQSLAQMVEKAKSWLTKAQRTADTITTSVRDANKAAAEPTPKTKEALERHAKDLGDELPELKDELSEIEAEVETASRHVEGWSRPGPAASKREPPGEEGSPGETEPSALTEAPASRMPRQPAKKQGQRRRNAAGRYVADAAEAVAGSQAGRCDTDLEKELAKAQQVADEAPRITRRAQERLTLAREDREAAEKRLQEAEVSQDNVVREFIEGIDLSEPDAAGVVTAEAIMKQELPPGYRLHWSFRAGDLVIDQIGESITVPTGEMPTGSYDIVMRVERESMTS